MKLPRNLLLAFIFINCFHVGYACADQVVALCTQSQSGAFTNCTPVSTSAPLPVKIGN